MIVDKSVFTRSLGDLAERYEQSDDFYRILTAALSAISEYQPLIIPATLKLQVGTNIYPVPTNFIGYKSSNWGQAEKQTLKPWDEKYPRTLPRVTVIGDDEKFLNFSFAPTAELINQCGGTFNYLYKAGHYYDSDTGKCSFHKFELLLLRFQIEALKETSIRQSIKIASNRDSISGQTRNGTPAALHEQLMIQFNRQVLQ